MQAQTTASGIRFECTTFHLILINTLKLAEEEVEEEAEAGAEGEEGEEAVTSIKVSLTHSSFDFLIKLYSGQNTSGNYANNSAPIVLPSVEFSVPLVDIGVNLAHRQFR